MTNPTSAEVGVSIQGVVVDSSGTPLGDVHLRLLEYPVWAVSDPAGHFSFRGVPAGSYTIEATCLGFAPVALSSIESPHGETARVRIALHPQPIRLPEAVVTPARPALADQSGERIILTCRDWDHSGADDLTDVLRDLPGITILEGSGVRRISLRGSPPRTVAVYLDGAPLNDPGAGEADLSPIPLKEVESIRIDFAGLGGAVNLSTRKPLAAAESSLSISAASGLRRSGGWNAAGSGEITRPSFGLAVGVNRQVDPGDFPFQMDDGQVRQRVNNASRSDFLNLKTALRLNSTSLDASALLIDTDRGVPGLLYAAPTPQAALAERRLLASANLSRSFPWGVGRALAHFSRFLTHFLSPAQQFNPETGQTISHLPEDNRYTSLGSGLRLSLASLHPVKNLPMIKDWSVDASSQIDTYRGEDLLRGTTTVASAGRGRARRDVHSLLLQTSFGRGNHLGWTWRTSPQANLAAVINQGARDYWFLAPDAAFSAGWSDAQTAASIHAGWGRSLSAPPFNAQFLVENAASVGNPDLLPEQGEGWRTGGDYSRWISKARIEGGLTFFDRQTRDLIVWKRSSAGRYYPDNLTRVRSRGWEFRGRLEAFDNRLTIGGDYRLEDARLNIPGDVNDGHHPPLTAQHSGGGRASLIHRWLNVSLQARWASRRYSTESNLDELSTAGMGLDPYVVWDVSMQRTVRVERFELDFRGGVDNLLDRNYRLIERSPLPGRVWRVEVRGQWTETSTTGFNLLRIFIR